MDKNLKVEWTTKAYRPGGVNREVFWRVDPSCLKWWQRIFNPWRKMYTFDHRGRSDDIFSPEEFKLTKKECQTVGDIYKTFENARKRREEAWNI